MSADRDGDNVFFADPMPLTGKGSIMPTPKQPDYSKLADAYKRVLWRKDVPGTLPASETAILGKEQTPEERLALIATRPELASIRGDALAVELRFQTPPAGESADFSNGPVTDTRKRELLARSGHAGADPSQAGPSQSTTPAAHAGFRDIDAQARVFFQEAMAQGKAAESERDLLIAQFKQAAIDDGGGTVRFNVDGDVVEGPRLKSIREGIAARKRVPGAVSPARKEELLRASGHNGERGAQ